MERYDLVVIGAGPAGFAGAVKGVLVKTCLDSGSGECRLNAALPVGDIPGRRILDDRAPDGEAIDGWGRDGGAPQGGVKNIRVVCSRSLDGHGMVAPHLFGSSRAKVVAAA